MRTPPNTFLHGRQPRYRVVGGAVVVPGSGDTLYRGQWLPADTPLTAIEHLLGVELIEEVPA